MRGQAQLFIIALALLFDRSTSHADSGKLNDLYYETKGNGEAVVLMHGGQLDRRMRDGQYDLFSKKCRVIRYDIRGFGKSDSPQKHIQTPAIFVLCWSATKAALTFKCTRL